MSPQNTAQTQQRDELLAALTSEYCRFVLRHFEDASDVVATVEDLSTAYARENGGDEAQAAVRFHHTALPKLSGVGAVDYDARSNTVRYYGHSRWEDCHRILASESESAVEVR